MSVMRQIKRITRCCALGAMCVATTSVLAQAASEPTRAQVKAETRAAEKAGLLTPAGEAAAFSKPLPTTSAKSRVERKAETRQARREHKLAEAGESAEVETDASARSTASNRTRAERKAETLGARKAKTLVPAGEGPGAPAK